MIYTIWDHGKGNGNGMVQGTHVPRFANGTKMEKVNIAVKVFEAKNHDAALKVWKRFLNAK